MRPIILALAILLAAQAPIFGQFRTKGLGLSLRGQATTWKLNDIEGITFDWHNGGGIGAEVFYGMSQYFGLFGRIDLSNMSSDEGNSYTLTHLDVGVRVLPMLAPRQVRPYAELAFAARSTQFDVGTQSLEASGPGATVGGGCLVFFASRFAVGLSADGTFGNLEQLTLGGFTVDTSAKATSWRGAASLVWFP